jgi:hypothetical protein
MNLELRMVFSSLKPERGMRNDAPILNNRSFLRLSKRAYPVQRRQHVVLFRLLAPCPIPPKGVRLRTIVCGFPDRGSSVFLCLRDRTAAISASSVC